MKLTSIVLTAVMGLSACGPAYQASDCPSQSFSHAKTFGDESDDRFWWSCDKKYQEGLRTCSYNRDMEIRRSCERTATLKYNACQAGETH